MGAPAHTGFADDLLEGAAEISLFLFGTREKRRKVYYLAANTRLPVFKLGSEICARRSVLLTWVQDQENRRAGNGAHATPKNSHAYRNERTEVATQPDGDA